MKRETLLREAGSADFVVKSTMRQTERAQKDRNVPTSATVSFRARQGSRPVKAAT